MKGWWSHFDAFTDFLINVCRTVNSIKGKNTNPMEESNQSKTLTSLVCKAKNGTLVCCKWIDLSVSQPLQRCLFWRFHQVLFLLASLHQGAPGPCLCMSRALVLLVKVWRQWQQTGTVADCSDWTGKDGDHQAEKCSFNKWRRIKPKRKRLS